jgi:hypothetical protein
VTRISGSLFAAFIFIGAAQATVAHAQLIPGGRTVDVDLQRAQFNSVMLKTIRATIDVWQLGWPIAGGRNRIVEQYSEAATLVQPGGALISGTDAIRAVTDSLRARVRSATVAFTDFEASEGIAYIYGPLTLDPRVPTLAAVNGQHLTVLKRESKGFRIRSQLLLTAKGEGGFPRLPARHPSGPLTIQAMAHPAIVARYRNAHDLLNQVHVAWSNSDTTQLFSLLSENVLVQLPGQAEGVVGLLARRELANLLDRAGDLHLATLDYEGASRISVLVGQYYLELEAGTAATGYFAMVLAGEGNVWKVRSLVFTT